MSDPTHSGGHNMHHSNPRHWRDTTSAVALDIVSKLFVIIGTPVIGWVLLSVIDHSSRLSTVETRQQEQSISSKERWTTVDASLQRLEAKFDRLLETKTLKP